MEVPVKAISFSQPNGRNSTAMSARLISAKALLAAGRLGRRGVDAQKWWKGPGSSQEVS